MQPYPPGFLLRFPRRRAPYQLPDDQDFPKLAAVFREHRAWMEIMKIGDVSSLNDAIQDGRMQEVILVNEALHEQRIATIAHDIGSRRERVRLPGARHELEVAAGLLMAHVEHGVRGARLLARQL